ncbi:MAG TPA: AMP-binding protein [Terriglobales bacterium]|nr:AMP-binding protein [Terriglobales bacterium]
MNFYDAEPGRQQALALERLFIYLREYVGKYHPYLRRLYREKGISLQKLRTRADLLSVPLLYKDQLRANPSLLIMQPHVPGGPSLPDGYGTEALKWRTILKYGLQATLNRPRDFSLAVRHPTLREKIRRRGQLEWLPIHFHSSTGSTGEPTPVGYTLFDIRDRVSELASLVIQEKQPNPNFPPHDWSERWMSLMPAAPHIAFFSSVLGKLGAGTPSFETFGGAVIPTDRQVELFAKGGFSGLVGIPSYVTHWLRRAIALQKEERVGPLAKLRRMLLGAEPISDALREYIRNLALEAGARQPMKVIQTYGMTELKWVFYECAEGAGIHLNPKYYYWELLDPETHRPVGPGEPGVLVFSHVGWRGTVLIRYWTGDLIKGGMRWDRCEQCGYTFPRIYSPICRADKDFTKLKGTRVDLSLLITTVQDTPGVRRFQITLDNMDQSDGFSRDVIEVHVLEEPGAGRSEIEEAIRQRMKSMIEVTPDSIVFETNEAEFEKRLFSRNGVKADYIVERRKNAL